MFRTGVQFHSGGLSFSPSFAIVLPVAGNRRASVTNNGHGLVTEPSSKKLPASPREPDRLPVPALTSWQGVVPAQIIFSGH